MSIWRKIAGVLTGVLTAGLVIASIEAAGHAALTGRGPFVAAIGGLLLGAFAGTWLSARIAGAAWARAVPVALAILTAINLAAMPHPSWFAPGALAALAIGWWAASRVARSDRSDG